MKKSAKTVFIPLYVIITKEVRMLSITDFKEKQILVLWANKNEKIQFLNSNLVLRDEDNKIKHKVSCYKIFVLFVVGEITLTSQLMKNAKKFSFPLIFMNRNFKNYAVLTAETEGNFLLRKKQYLNEEKSFYISKHLVSNKIENQITLLKKIRYKSKSLKLIIKELQSIRKRVSNSKNNFELMGIEGLASKKFFNIYFKHLEWKGRKPRTKQDIINLLMDIGYTYLFNFIDTLLRIYGFDVYKGVYHQLFFQRKSLVCDLIEPFRCIIDSKIHKAYNLKQIQERDFVFKNGQYQLPYASSKEYSKLFFKSILDYRVEIFSYIQKYYRAFVKDKTIEKYPQFTI